MNVTDLADPAAAHRDAVARHQDAAAKAAEAQRVVDAAAATRASVLMAASRGEAGTDELRAADDALADAKRLHEIADAATIAARGVAQRAEVSLLRHQADLVAAEVAACHDRAQGAVADVIARIADANDALGRLRDAAAEMPLGQMRVAEHNRLVEATATTNGNLGRTPLADRPTLKQSPARIDVAGLAVVLADMRYDIDAVDPRQWIAARPVSAGP